MVHYTNRKNKFPKDPMRKKGFEITRFFSVDGQPITKETPPNPSSNLIEKEQWWFQKQNSKKVRNYENQISSQKHDVSIDEFPQKMHQTRFIV